MDVTATMWPYIDRVPSLACSLPSQIIEQIRRFGATDLQASVQRVMFRDLERDAVTGIEFSTVFDLHADHNDMVQHLSCIELDFQPHDREVGSHGAGCRVRFFGLW